MKRKVALVSASVLLFYLCLWNAYQLKIKSDQRRARSMERCCDTTCRPAVLGTRSPVTTMQTNTEAIQKCPSVSPLLKGNLNVSFEDKSNKNNWPPTLEEIAINNPSVGIGGVFPGPMNCIAKQSVVVVVPFRDRQVHLRFFLHYMHTILQRQQLSYTIIVVEQDMFAPFNKGQLMNIGFLYARNLTKMDRIDCIIFHDVDTISEDDRTLYSCKDETQVAHIASKIDKFNYRLCCGITVGGAVGFTVKQFTKVNGFSNQYYGWGGEDDDMYARIEKVGKFKVHRNKKQYSRFKMIPHRSDVNNPKNPERYKLLDSWWKRQPKDGLNSVKAEIKSVTKYFTHTRIIVRVSPVSAQNKKA